MSRLVIDLGRLIADSNTLLLRKLAPCIPIIGLLRVAYEGFYLSESQLGMPVESSEERYLRKMAEIRNSAETKRTISE